MQADIEDLIVDPVIYKDPENIPNYVSWEKPEDNHANYDVNKVNMFRVVLEPTFNEPPQE